MTLGFPYSLGKHSPPKRRALAVIAVQDFMSSTKDPSRPPYISLLLFPNDRCNSQLRSAAFHMMRTGVPGFKIDNMLGGPREGEFNDSFFIADGVHPFGESGHRRVLAYLFLHPPLLSDYISLCQTHLGRAAERALPARTAFRVYLLSWHCTICIPLASLQGVC